MPLLDIRSPGEYEKGHIPGAISFPLFSNDERATIGTLYKKEGRNSAVKQGLEIVGPKLLQFVHHAEALGSKSLAMYCWRGGMRSDSMAWLLEKAGFEIQILEGGYKTYRNAMLDFFHQALPLIVLTGFTGSRKTDLLSRLKIRGEQVLDLEGLAGHQGSSFGNQKTNGQPSSEHFQNIIYRDCLQFDLKKPIWVEDECHRIGQVTLPDDLFQQMGASPHVFLEVPLDERIEFLVSDYGNLPVSKLVQATTDIRKKLGFDRAAEAIEHIRRGELPQAVEIILSYYDRYYLRSITKKKSLIIKTVSGSLKELDKLTDELTELNSYAV